MMIEPDLVDMFGIIWHRIWIVLLAMIVGGAAAYLFGSNRAPLFTATAEVLVRPTLTNPTRPPEPLSMTTEKRVAGSTGVAELAIVELGTEADLAALLDGISVSSTEGSEILEISFTDRDPVVAQRSAQAVADSYLLFRSQQAIDVVAAHAASLEEEIVQAESAIARVNDRLASVGPESLRWQAVLDRRNDLADLRLSLKEQLVPIETLSTDPGEVIDPAVVPSSPSSPKPLMFAAAGALLGLLFGVSLAYTWPGGRMRPRRLVAPDR